MYELTPEEKQKIYAEEKARLEAKAQIEDKTKPKKKPVGCGTFILIIGALVVVGYMINSFSAKSTSPPRSTTTSTPAPRVTKPPLRADFNKWTRDEFGNYTVVGEVVNVSDKTFRFVEVKAEFLNDAGAVVGTDTTYACGEDYILPGGKKSFKMMGDQQSDYKTLRISIYDYMVVR